MCADLQFIFSWCLIVFDYFIPIILHSRIGHSRLFTSGLCVHDIANSYMAHCQMGKKNRGCASCVFNLGSSWMWIVCFRKCNLQDKNTSSQRLQKRKHSTLQRNGARHLNIEHHGVSKYNTNSTHTHTHAHTYIRTHTCTHTQHTHINTPKKNQKS